MSESLANLLAWVLTYAAHSTLFLGACWALLRLAKLDPLVRSRAWKVALVGGLVTSSLQIGLGLEPLAGRFDPETLLTQPEPAAEDDARVALAEPSGLPAPALTDEQMLAVLEHKLVALSTPTEVAAEPVESRELFGWMWFFGASYGVLGVFLRRTRFQRRVGDRIPVWDERIAAILTRLQRKAGIRRTVRLTRSRALRVPATWGLFAPEICLPDRALTELSDDELEAAVAHELGHVARGDAFWLAVGQLLDALCFFQPLNRVARRGIAVEAEHLADGFAVALTGRPTSLARSLAQVATWLDPRQERAERHQPTLVAMAATRHVLLERVERVLDRRAPRVRARGATTALLAVPVASILLLPAIGRTPIDATPAPSHDAEFADDTVRGDTSALGDGSAITDGAIPDGAIQVTVAPAGQSAGGTAPVFTNRGQLVSTTSVGQIADQIAELERELTAMERHPRAKDHAELLESARTRLAKLRSMVERVAQFSVRTPRAATRLPSPEWPRAAVLSPNVSGEASAGRTLFPVPPTRPDSQEPNQ